MKWIVVLLLKMFLVSCSVQVKAPDRPIEINLNINHNIKIQVDKKLENTIEENKDIF